MDGRYYHAYRSHKVSSRHPRRGVYGYDGERVMSDADDDVVTEIVAAWKKAQGLNVTYRQATGEVRSADNGTYVRLSHGLTDHTGQIGPT